MHKLLNFFYFISYSVFSAMSLLNKCLCGRLRPKASSFSRSPSSVGLSPAVRKKLQTPCGQMTKFSRGESRAGVCFPVATPVVGSFVPLFSCVLSTLRSCTAATGPGLKSVTSDQAITPGWLTTSVRKNYLHHEWTCLFIEMAP